MRLATLLAALSEWARALAGPFALFLIGAALSAFAWRCGIDRLWLLAIIGALTVGVAIGLAGLIATTHNRRQHAKRRHTDGEGEPL